MKEDKIIEMLINQQEKLDSLQEKVSKIDTLEGTMNNIQETLDVIVGFHKKRDEEMTFVSYRLQEHEKDIKALKKVTHLD